MSTTTRQTQRLELLLEVGRLLASKLEISELLITILDLAKRIVNAERASLLLLDEATQELYFDVAQGLGEQASRVRLKLGQGIAGSVAKSQLPEIINDVRKSPHWSPAMDAKTGFVTRSILAVPILFKGRLLGVVEAINKENGDFKESDQEAFLAFASQAGVAIDNARLFSSLREERFKLETVFSQMQDGAVLADAAGKVLLANNAAARLLGAPPRELATAFASLNLTPTLPQLLKAERSVVDFTAARPEPTLLVLAGHVTAARLSSDEGRLFVFRDDTEAWRQGQLKRTFLSLVSHKLKTPLTSVIGYSESLLADLDPNKTDQRRLKALRTIHIQGTKIAELLEKMLRYTAVDDPDAAPDILSVPVDEAVAEAVKGLEEKLVARGASVDYKPTGLVVPADREMLVEILKSLIDNSVKADAKPSPVVTVRAAAAKGWTELSVADTGAGIPPESQEAVFSRFHQVEKDFTGQKEGMGLGLPYVRRAAELHGGSVALSSSLGQGTTVVVRLPARRPA